MYLKKIVQFFAMTAILVALTVYGNGWSVQAQSSSQEISWEDLGLGEGLRLQGAVTSRDIFIPAPPGLTPMRLAGTIHLSPDIVSGYLEIRNRDRLVATLQLEQGVENVDIDIPLADTQIEKDVLPLTFIARLRSQDDICTNTYTGGWVEIALPVIYFEGAPTPPHTVAEFFPPVLHQVFLVTSSDPTPQESQAVLVLAAALMYRYRNTELHIETLPLTKDNTPPIPTVAQSMFARMVIIQEKKEDGVHLAGRVAGIPILKMAGPGPALVEQSRWLASNWRRAAQSPEIKRLNYIAPEKTTRDRVLLFDLHPPGLNVEGMGRMDIPVTFSQGDIGGPVSKLGVRLAGHYTPPHPDSQATLSVYFNGGIIYATILNEKDSFDLYASVPNDLLQRDNVLTIRFTYTPSGGDCRLNSHPFAASIDKGSYLSVKYGGDPPIRFTHFPQILLPAFHVAFSTPSFADLNAAAQIVAGLQRLTRTPLSPSVVSWNDAITSSQPAVLISHSPEQVRGLEAPVLLEPFRILDNQSREVLRFDASASFGLAETFQHKKQAIFLVAASPRVGSEQIVDAIRNQPGGWYGLQGDFLIVTDQGDSVMLQAQEGGVTIEPLSPTAKSWLQKWRAIIYPLTFLLILILAAWLYPRLARTAPDRE